MGTLHVRAVVLPGAVEQDLYVSGGCYVSQTVRAETLHIGGYLLPGLVDMHNHLSLRSPAGDTAPPGHRVRASGRQEVNLLGLPGIQAGAPAYLVVSPDSPLLEHDSPCRLSIRFQ